jgi:hypothetical protein
MARYKLRMVGWTTVDVFMSKEMASCRHNNTPVAQCTSFVHTQVRQLEYDDDRITDCRMEVTIISLLRNQLLKS